ncbi:MAG: futalosine hydrolase [Desulfurivibrio sp.]|jgi:futalosine hydrolase|nr:MAG: futalosine hydrolase [Desulfurivibrio sp.]
MYLLVAATELELAPARQALAGTQNLAFLLSGVGPVDAAFALTRYLSLHYQVSAVINFGVAGAYRDTGLAVLDLCVAQQEVLADLGICYTDRIEPLAIDALAVNREFTLDSQLYQEARRILGFENIPFVSGRFLTVSCASGTGLRGDYLHTANQGICENMEGAALARVCQGFGVDFLELRSVSNMVEDRDPARWRLKEACAAAGFAVARVVQGLSSAELSRF